MLYDGPKPEIQIADNELITNESLFKAERCPKSEETSQIGEITVDWNTKLNRYSKIERRRRKSERSGKMG